MYGIIISVSILVCTLIVEYLAKKERLNTQLLWSSLIWVIIIGVIGARTYHVLDYYEVYSQNPSLIFKVWNGGLGIIGGIIGGTLAATIFLKIKKEPVMPWLNLVALIFPLGQALGRLGNYFNKELYPIYIIEPPLTLLLFGILLLVKKYKKNKVFVSYVIGYTLIRLVTWRFYV